MGIKVKTGRAKAAAPAVSPAALSLASPSAALAEVSRLYGKYNPEKLVDVPTLVAKYGEGKLLSMVQKKYKEQETAAVLEPSLRQVQQLPAEEEDRFKDDAPYPDSPPPARPEGGHRFEDGAPSPAPAVGGGGTASLGKIVVCAETLLQAAVDGQVAVLAHCLASGEVWPATCHNLTSGGMTSYGLCLGSQEDV